MVLQRQRQFLSLCLMVFLCLDFHGGVVVAEERNRLADEKSPYLLQHADNPVNWYAWSNEAFDRARAENKPIFLSIGYSTCHWCHVMAHESFENDDVAAFINKDFIAIKVDREERPDIDNIYMTAVMSMTGQGGWPLTVFLTPDKKPFFGGTYFPPFAKWGSPGLVDILNNISGRWSTDSKSILESSENITRVLRERESVVVGDNVIDASILDQAYREYTQTFDSQYGGFGTQPKFPSSHNLSLLLRYWHRTGKKEALAMVEKTLDNIADGGIYDHVGGGFHRYATDQYWQIPHFEKMLYDQAMLGRTYVEAYQITKNPKYERVAREIFDYVLRDMTDVKGAFHSAEDADSLDPDEFSNMSVEANQSHEKKEGAYFLWRYEEIKDILNKDEFSVFSAYYDIRQDGNAHSDPHQEFTGKNIIFVKSSIDEVSVKHNQTNMWVEEILKSSREKLLKHRNQRPHPHLDDKILTDWNGLMIGSLAYGARVLDEARYLKAAENATQFILTNMFNDDGRLLHRYREGDAAVFGSIEDYAFLSHALLDLYDVTLDVVYLKKAHELAQSMLILFWDDRKGGFYFTAHDSEVLLFQQKEIYDGAIPSGNSMAAMVLVRLSHITFDSVFNKKLEEMFKIFSSSLKKRPSAYAQMLSAFSFVIGPSVEIVIAEGKEFGIKEEVLKYIAEEYIPNGVILLRPFKTKEREILTSMASFVEKQQPLKDKTTVYVCQNHVCKLPVTNIEDLQKVLKPLVREDND